MCFNLNSAVVVLNKKKWRYGRMVHIRLAGSVFLIKINLEKLFWNLQVKVPRNLVWGLLSLTPKNTLIWVYLRAIRIGGLKNFPLR